MHQLEARHSLQRASDALGNIHPPLDIDPKKTHLQQDDVAWINDILSKLIRIKEDREKAIEKQAVMEETRLHQRMDLLWRQSDIIIAPEIRTVLIDGIERARGWPILHAIRDCNVHTSEAARLSLGEGMESAYQWAKDCVESFMGEDDLGEYIEDLADIGREDVTQRLDKWHDEFQKHLRALESWNGRGLLSLGHGVPAPKFSERQSALKDVVAERSGIPGPQIEHMVEEVLLGERMKWEDSHPNTSAHQDVPPPNESHSETDRIIEYRNIIQHKPNPNHRTWTYLNGVDKIRVTAELLDYVGGYIYLQTSPKTGTMPMLKHVLLLSKEDREFVRVRFCKEVLEAFAEVLVPRIWTYEKRHDPPTVEAQLMLVKDGMVYLRVVDLDKGVMVRKISDFVKGERTYAVQQERRHIMRAAIGAKMKQDMEIEARKHDVKEPCPVVDEALRSYEGELEWEEDEEDHQYDYACFKGYCDYCNHNHEDHLPIHSNRNLKDSNDEDHVHHDSYTHNIKSSKSKNIDINSESEAEIPYTSSKEANNAAPDATDLAILTMKQLNKKMSELLGTVRDLNLAMDIPSVWRRLDDVEDVVYFGDESASEGSDWSVVG